VAIVYGQSVVRAGAMPPNEWLFAFLKWVKSTFPNAQPTADDHWSPVFACSNLNHFYAPPTAQNPDGVKVTPAADGNGDERIPALASGALVRMFYPAKGGADHMIAVVCLRREMRTDALWGGDPTILAQTDITGSVLAPRNSFASYRQTVINQAQPWSALHVRAFEAITDVFRSAVLKRGPHLFFDLGLRELLVDMSELSSRLLNPVMMRFIDDGLVLTVVDQVDSLANPTSPSGSSILTSPLSASSAQSSLSSSTSGDALSPVPPSAKNLWPAVANRVFLELFAPVPVGSGVFVTFASVEVTQLITLYSCSAFIC